MSEPQNDTDESVAEALDALDEAIEAKQGDRALEILKTLDWEDQRRAISRLTRGEAETLLDILGIEQSAKLLSHLTEAQAVEIIESLPPNVAAAILDEMPAEESSNILRELHDDDAKEIIAGIGQKEDRDELRKRLEYEDGCAGSLMRGYPVTFRENSTVGEVLQDLGEHAEDYSDRDVQYLYVIDEKEVVVGVLRLRDLVLSLRHIPVRELMIPEPVTVIDTMPLDDLAELFEKKKYFGLPVVDSAGRILGVVPRDSVEHETAEEQADMFLAASGIVNGEELRSMELKDRCIKRLSWLAPNIVLNIAAASIIAANEATLQEVIALAVFLPIVSDMSGCSGNQAVAVSIRELTLGILRPKDYWRIVVKEGSVGVINGIVLGIVLGAIAYLYKGNIYLSLTVAIALSLNTILSVLLGGLVPLFLKRMKVDPALASGPILTTCTDMCGFLLVLSIASSMLSKLSGI
ncbi:MAG: magnesium transporter [Akkermansiaceae bacterium]|jgi:magnesium transporter|nr:magnesium transporter [Akkermansiaceae bacterium]MDP4646374.1 magnesium transporter [Akkermansiaceae bacterium]MDP4721935.1 magnesium transporter [Akkermansiaceae bacterium]MDP4779977.1 magnesium transporter [Akkermansiaceae bacterium]MDP4847097.1 magnesium transporter [Akkermansiaceae bacterium]